MFKLLSDYKVGRFSLVFLASCYASLRLTEQVFRPTLERLWRKLSSDEALDLYAYCIVFVHDIAILSAKLALAAGRDARRWVDAFVELHLASEPVAQAETVMVEPIESATVAEKEVEPWDEPLPSAPVPVPAPAPIAHFPAFLPALPPAKLEPQQEPAKRKRGRPKGSRNKQRKVA